MLVFLWDYPGSFVFLLFFELDCLYLTFIDFKLGLNFLPSGSFSRCSLPRISYFLKVTRLYLGFTHLYWLTRLNLGLTHLYLGLSLFRYILGSLILIGSLFFTFGSLPRVHSSILWVSSSILRVRSF